MIGLCHEHNGKFQALAAMHCHDGHTARLPLALIGAGDAIAFCRRVHAADQRAKAALPCLPCPAHKALQALLPNAAPRHGPHSGHIAGFCQNFFQQLGTAHGAGRTAQHTQPLAELLHFFVLACGQRTIQAPARGFRTQRHQIIRRKAEHGAEHSRGQRNILRRVIQNTQQRSQRLHLRRFQQIFRYIRIHGDSLLFQFRGIGRKAFSPAQKDAEIPPFAGAQHITVAHKAAAVDHFAYHAGDHRRIAVFFFGFQRHKSAKAGIVGHFTGQSIAVLPVRCARHQCLTRAVIHTAQLTAHDLLKEIVDGIHHRRGRAEIGVQFQRNIFFAAVVSGLYNGPAVHFFHENRRVGLAEAVNALLQVPHQKAVAALRICQACVNGVLQSVGILIFVHQNGGIILRKAGCGLGGLAVLILQQLQCQMFKIREFQNLLCLFCLKENRVKALDRPCQRTHQRCRHTAILLKLLGCADQKFLGHFSDDILFIAVTHKLGDLFIFGLFTADRPHFLPAPAFQRFPGFFPGAHLPGVHLFQLFFQPADGQFIALQRRNIFFLSVFALLRHPFGSGCHGERRVCLLQRTGGQLTAPRGVLHGIPQLPRTAKFFQRFPWLGQTAQKIIQLQDQIARLAVISAAAVQIGKAAKIRIMAAFFHHLRQRFFAQARQLGGIGRGEIRRNIQRCKVFLQK